jgi:hypothetical protein
MDAVNHRYIYTSIPMVNLFLSGVGYAPQQLDMHTAIGGRNGEAEKAISTSRAS